MAALLSLCLGVLGLGGGSFYVAWWGIGGPLAIGLLAIFATRDTAARAGYLYSAPAWVPQAYWTSLALSLCAILVNSLHIAFWVGRS